MAVNNSGLVDEIGTYGSEEELQTAETQNQAIGKWKGGIKTGRKIWATHGEYVLPENF